MLNPSHRSSDTTVATVGSLYLAGFQQAGQPHVALILATDEDHGRMAHITTKGTGVWHYEFIKQNIARSISLTSLLCIHDATHGDGATAITAEALDSICKDIDYPDGAEVGECIKWVSRVLKKMASDGVIHIKSSVDALLEEFDAFVKGNKAFATQSRYPNVKM